MTWLAYLDGAAVQVVAKAAPWLAPLPTAWLVFDRTQQHLGWPWPVALVAGLTLEALGVAILATTLEQYSYNRSKRKSDPAAPLWIPLLLVGLYFIAAELLIVALDIAPGLVAPWAAAVFPVLSVAAFATLAVRADHEQRVAGVAAKKEREATARKQRRAERKAVEAEQIPNDAELEPEETPAPTFATKGELVRHLMETEPNLTRTELSVRSGASASYVSELVRTGSERKETES